MDYMRKFLRFTDALNSSGIVSDLQEGDTVVICDDCIVIITRTGDTVGYTIIDQMKRFHFRLDFTEEDYEDFVSYTEKGGFIIQQINSMIDRGRNLWKRLLMR